MVNCCIVSSCKRESYPGCGFSFHSIPNDKDRRELWLKAINHIESKVPKTIYVCGLHFKDDDYVTVARVRLKPQAVPSVNLCTTEPEPEVASPEFCNIAYPGTSGEQRKAFAAEPPNKKVKQEEFGTQADIPTPRKLKLCQDMKNLKRKLKRRDSKILNLNTILELLKRERGDNVLEAVLNNNSLNKPGKGARYDEEPLDHGKYQDTVSLPNLRSTNTPPIVCSLF